MHDFFVSLSCTEEVCSNMMAYRKEQVPTINHPMKRSNAMTKLH